MTPILIAAVMLTQNAGPQSINSADTAELNRLEREWNDAHVRGDARVLDRLWADEFVATVPGMPRFTKSQTMQIWRSGRMRFERYETCDLQIQTYGTPVVTTAVVTGQLHRTRVLGGRKLDDNWQFTKTYIHSPTGWRVVAFHASDSPKASLPKQK
jgi:Domain of unknown function (DUF4440)